MDAAKVLDAEKVDRLSGRQLDDYSIMRLVDFYKLFSDNTRLKILHLLSMDELCVGDIAAVLSCNQSTVSHQLKTLRNSRLVRTRREGKVVFYSLDDEHIGHIILQGILHIGE